MKLLQSTKFWLIATLIMIGLAIWSYAYAQKVLGENKNNENEQHSNLPSFSPAPTLPKVQGGTHPIKSPSSGNQEAIYGYLASKNSPLKPYAGDIIQSQYFSTIIAITAAEESFSINPTCQATGKPSNNLYGMMKPGGERAGLRCFDSILDGWNYMNDYFTRYEARYPTIESWKGVYCASACLSWYPTVIKIKSELESQ